MTSDRRQLLETMFYCMPIRLGVFLVAIFQTICSILWVVDKSGWEHSFRHMMGGYALASRLAVGLIEVTGIVAGALGVLGCWYVRPTYIQTYKYWQYLRCVGLLLVYTVDVPLVANCEAWVNNIEQIQKVHGWNDLMYQLAIGGYCNSERTLFFVSTSITFALCVYVASCTGRYQEMMDKAPRHLLRVPKDLASGAFYSHSHGERAYLNGTFGQRSRQGAPPPNVPFQGSPQQFGQPMVV